MSRVLLQADHYPGTTDIMRMSVHEAIHFTIGCIARSVALWCYATIRSVVEGLMRAFNLSHRQACYHLRSYLQEQAR